jgi:hypothetical protein
MKVKKRKFNSDAKTWLLRKADFDLVHVFQYLKS